MNQQQAKWLLDETFNQKFDVLKFSNFLKELVNNSNLYTQDKTQFVAGEFRDYILKVEKLGQYKDKAGKSMELLAIKLAKHSSLERARTMQRNFIAKWLLKNPDEPEGAIVGFYDDEKDWRFSFVKLEYNLIKDEKGNLKAKKELTPAKRYSYLVGPNEPNHTCKKQFVELLSSDHDPLFEEIEKSFGIEKVTKEFFEEYKKRFLDLKESLEKVIKNNVIVRDEFLKINNYDDELLSSFIEEFSKKLLGQLVFLYFLQKKGWLGVGIYEDWGTGPKDFMRRLFGGGIKNYIPLVKYKPKYFFNDILEPLFYDTLARKRDGDYCKFNDVSFKIPFLNGGLFEPLNNYRWEATEILIDDDIFNKIFSTFDTFNFTIKEDEPLEKEVAVDPEMLGKVFEKLLEVTDRKSKGAYYTPREIVHYMCQQSLINYLETNSSIHRKDIEKFIQEGDKYLDQTIKAQEHKKKYHGNVYGVDSEYTIPKSIEENYQLIDELLKTIKVVDPAVGSGAFPVGMMNEIVKARSILSIYFDTERDVSEIKRECIENSLYGVDIMPSAVDICQLRFWLSLVVDELDRKKIKPLPNLDNKIMCGNSLLEEFEGVKLFDDSLLGEEVKDIRPELDRIDKEIKELNLKAGEIILGKSKGSIDDIKKSIKKLEREKNKLLEKPKETTVNATLTNFDKVTRDEAKIKLKKLKAKQKEFFNSFDRDTKKQLKQEIEKLEWELIEATLKQQGNDEAIRKLNSIMKSKSKPFFLWKLYFAEVFQRENPGFDVVIGNPPYLEFDELRLNDENFIIYRDGFKMKYKFNLFSLFLKKGPELLRTKGVISYIVPNSFSKEKYNEDIREEYIKNMNIISFVDFTQEKKPVFENASNDSYIVFLVEKFHKEESLIIIDRYMNKNFEYSHSINQDELLKSFDYQFNISLNNGLIKKIEKNTLPLGKITLIRVGLTPSKPYKNKYGDDYSNFLEKHQKQSNLYKLLKQNKKDDICDRYRLLHKTDHIVWDRDYLYKDKVCPGEFEDYFNPKLIFRNRGNKILGSFDENNIFVNDIFNVVVLKHRYKNDRVDKFNSEDIELSKKFSEKYLLSIINSKVMNFYLWNAFVFRDIKAPMMKNFPIKILSPEQQKPFIQLVDQILSITKDEDYLKNPDKESKVKKLEKEIDNLVYDLYELTPEEIKIVEEFNQK